MSNTKVPLATVAKISSGKRPSIVQKSPTEKCSVPIIGSGGISGFTTHSIEPAGSLITGRVGTLGKLHVAADACWPSDNALVLCPITDLVTPSFLRYAVSEVIAAAAEMNRGAANPLLTQRDLGRLEVAYFPIAEQHEISDILQTLDDKIEVNRKASATLEEMARALYRSWFVDFDPVHAKAEGRSPAHMDAATAALFPDSFGEDGLPEGWLLGTLGQVAMNPRASVRPEQLHSDTPYIGLEHMPRRSIMLSEWGQASDVGSQKSGMSKGDFLFGKLRPYFHKVGIVPIDGICSTDIIVVRAKEKAWSGYVLATISSDAFVEHTNSGSSGTRMPRTNWADMAAYEIAVPPMEIAAAYEAITKPWRDRILAMVHEAKTLAVLRDSLLPRLMSGELRVGTAKDVIEEAL